MRSIFVHLSSLLGLLIFINQLSDDAALENTVFLAFGVGLAAYLVLLLGYSGMHYVLHRELPRPAVSKEEEDAEDAASKQAEPA